MLSRVRIVGLAVVAIVLSLVARTAESVDHPPPATQRTMGPAAIPAEQLTKTQFKALPDTAVIVLRDGTRTTPGELRATARRQRAAKRQVEVQAAAGQAHAAFQAHRAAFLSEQHAKLKAQHDKAWAEFGHLHQQQTTAVSQPTTHEAIYQEALQLLERAKTATPAEHEQLEQRAGQLLRQLEQIGR